MQNAMKGQRVTYHFLCALFILFFTTGTVLFGQARGDRVESLTEAAAGQLNVNLPLKHLHLTSSFGYRKHPLTGVGHFHEGVDLAANQRSEEHTSELQSLMRTSYAVFCLKKKQTTTQDPHHTE